MTKLVDKIREFAQGGATFAGTVRLMSWSDSVRGINFGFRVDDKDEDGDPLIQVNPFKGLPVGMKEGQKFVLIAVMLGDDKDSSGVPAAHDSPLNGDAPTDGNEQPGRRADTEKRAWKDMPYATRAGIRCAEPAFIEFMKSKYPVLADDALATPDIEPHEAAAYCVRTLCGVKSRSEIKPGSAAAKKFDEIESGYHFWIKYREVAA